MSFDRDTIEDKKQPDATGASAGPDRHLLRILGVPIVVSRGSDGKIELLSDAFTALFGYKIEDVPDMARWWALAYPNDAYRHAAEAQWKMRAKNATGNSVEIKPMESTVECKDGTSRCVELHFSHLDGADFVCFVDVTQRTLAEAASSMTSRKLIAAHERERARVGSQLHDDIGQQLALLAMKLASLERNLPKSAARLRRSIVALEEHACEISNAIGAASHELSTLTLATLGLVSATRILCKRVAEQQKLKIAFVDENIPHAVPDETSLCLFRVLQEALLNAAKHGARHCKVRLWKSSHEINVEIRDSGPGFHLETALTGSGLGLANMRERLRVLQGACSIHSQPGSGTTIHARLPLSSEDA